MGSDGKWQGKDMKAAIRLLQVSPALAPRCESAVKPAPISPETVSWCQPASHGVTQLLGTGNCTISRNEQIASNQCGGWCHVSVTKPHADMGGIQFPVTESSISSTQLSG